MRSKSAYPPSRRDCFRASLVEICDGRLECCPGIWQRLPNRDPSRQIECHNTSESDTGFRCSVADILERWKMLFQSLKQRTRWLACVKDIIDLSIPVARLIIRAAIPIFNQANRPQC